MHTYIQLHIHRRKNFRGDNPQHRLNPDDKCVYLSQGGFNERHTVPSRLVRSMRFHILRFLLAGHRHLLFLLRLSPCQFQVLHSFSRPMKRVSQNISRKDLSERTGREGGFKQDYVCLSVCLLACLPAFLSLRPSFPLNPPPPSPPQPLFLENPPPPPPPPPFSLSLSLSISPSVPPL